MTVKATEKDGLPETYGLGKGEVLVTSLQRFSWATNDPIILPLLDDYLPDVPCHDLFVTIETEEDDSAVI